MVYQMAGKLAQQLKESPEYRAYTEAREALTGNTEVLAMLEQYHRLQLKAQASLVQGREDEETMLRLRKLGEFLQMDEDASQLLIAEYRVKTMLGDVYRILAESVDMSLDGLGV